jgi:hypothetical protein
MKQRNDKKEQEQPKPEAKAEQGQVENTETVENQEQNTDQPEEQEQPKPEAKAEQKSSGKAPKKGEITPEIDAILKLYPQYEKVYITPQGFVHPENAPEYITKGATLYVNKYFNK